MNTKLDNIIVRKMPDAKLPLMRFQIGEMRKRLETVPVFDKDHHMIATRLGAPIMVFHVLGVGSSLEAARESAGLPPYPEDL